MNDKHYRDLDDDLQSEIFFSWLQEKAHAVSEKWLVIRIETIKGTSGQGLDAVAYDIEDLDEVSTLSDFEKYIKENDYDEENFEVDRCTVLRVKGE